MINKSTALLFDEAEGKRTTLSEKIKDENWFFSAWKKDPTVSSMLIMLDEIDLKLFEKHTDELRVYFDALTEQGIINFHFLDLDRFELTDELYVKMNARGKALTEWEQFKAWLQEFTKDKEIDIVISDWHRRLDLEWYDLFWASKEKGKYIVDDQYLQFFHLIEMFHLAEKMAVQGSKLLKDDEETLQKYRTGSYISLNNKLNKDVYNGTTLNNIFKVLNGLHAFGINEIKTALAPLYPGNTFDILDKFIGSKNKGINYWDRVFIYSISSVSS